MCSVSAVSDYYTSTYPGRLTGPPPNAIGMPAWTKPQEIVHTFDTETKDMLRQALRLLDKIDKRLGDVECMDETKAAFLATLGLKPEDIGDETGGLSG